MFPFTKLAQIVTVNSCDYLADQFFLHVNNKYVMSTLSMSCFSARARNEHKTFPVSPVSDAQQVFNEWLSNKQSVLIEEWIRK